MRQHASRVDTVRTNRLQPMTCAQCGTPIAEGSAFSEGGLAFCSENCRSQWRMRGRTRAASGAGPGRTAGAMEFPVEPPGFENRRMSVRLSTWGTPKLFLDGALLAPLRSGFLGLGREYRATDNAGKPTVLRLRRKPLDQVPVLEIDGREFAIARPLTSWEVIWISLPALLLFTGGAIGGAIGLSAVIVNSVLMRRIRRPVPRYLFTGVTTALAFSLFLDSVSVMRPLLDSIFGSSADDRIQAAVMEINRNCPLMLDVETRLDSASSVPGKILVYHYTLVRSSVEQLDIDQVKQSLRPVIVDNIRTKEEMRFLLENAVTFVYRYTDRNGRPAFELAVTPTDYQP